MSVFSARLTALVVGISMLASGVLVLAPAPAGASGAGGDPFTPFIIGGQESQISQFPWQVFVGREAEGTGASCGGSILNATTILTAAHCVVHDGTTTPYPAGDFFVVSGDSNVNGVSSTEQFRLLSSLRVHPYFTSLPDIKDDVAVLTLSAPLTLSPAFDTQAIGLVPSGATPPAGTPLSVSGYGKQEGAGSAKPNGRLYSTTLTAMSSEACGSYVKEEANSAVLLCAFGVSSATCQGDSGGPLTEGSPAVEVGLVDFGGENCPVGQPSGFTNLAAPEVRAFIEGSEAPPVAARPTTSPGIRGIGPGPVDFSPQTCEAGAWSGSPSFSYTFRAENASAQVFQSGPSAVFTPQANLVGMRVVCVVQASNPGGVTTVRSGPTPVITADTTPPVASITGLSCHLQACTLSLAAFDPNAVPFSVQPSGSYTANVKCPAKKRKQHKKAKKPAKAPVCHQARTVRMALRALSASSYQATASHLPYGEKIIFSVAVANAAGLHTAGTLARATTLHAPNKGKGKKKGKSNKKGKKGKKGKQHKGSSGGPLGVGPVGQ
jgi:Trypsin